MLECSFRCFVVAVSDEAVQEPEGRAAGGR